MDIWEKKICIDKTMVEFDPSEKIFNGKYLVKMISVDTKSTILNKPYGFTPSALATSTRLHITINNNNNIKLYEQQQ